jgi:tetratricopeptide (TPR) repeat protein
VIGRLARWLVGAGALIVGPSLAAQQPDPAAKAFDLERRGLHPQAIEAYRVILSTRPADMGALLGLERSLTAINKAAEMVPDLGRAIKSAEPSAALYGVAVRVYTAARMPDSARTAVDRWSKLEPSSEGPYQEWGSAALGARDRAAAKEAYALGRQRLRDDKLMAGELAQLATMELDYPTAVREWLGAIERTPGYRSAAVSMLSQIPAAGRVVVLRQLEQARLPAAERVAAALTIRWGDPVGGVRRIERAIPLLGPAKVEALQETLDDLNGQGSREANMARGIGLELLGTAGPNQGTRYWLEAAQAYAEAGDQGSARRMLGKLAGDPAASPTMAASATSTLVTVLVAEGKLEDATKRFLQLKAKLSEEERSQLQIKVAEGWIKAGKLDRAEQLVQADSSTDGLAIRGRIRLFQGDLAGAAGLLRDAGPFAGPRDAAVSRTTILALLQVIEEDSLPALGSALHKLERRDSAAGGTELEAVAATLEPAHGGAEVMLLAGRVRAGLGQKTEAEAQFRRAAELKVPAAAAAAELELGRLWVQGGQTDKALEILEHLLVTYPSSAVAPQARRLRDQAKGVIPPG